MQQHMARVFMFDDSLATRNQFLEYCDLRKDIEGRPHALAFDAVNEIKASMELGVDLILLDVRLPIKREELAGHPEEIAPYGVKLAEDLLRDRITASIPVILYTQYAHHPEVRNALEYASRKCPNVKHLIVSQKHATHLLDAGLPFIQALNVSLEPGQQPYEKKLLFNNGLKPREISKCTILLNGHDPAQCEALADGTGLYAWFHEAHFQRRYNYLMVRSSDGRKSILRVSKEP